MCFAVEGTCVNIEPFVIVGIIENYFILICVLTVWMLYNKFGMIVGVIRVIWVVIIIVFLTPYV